MKWMIEKDALDPVQERIIEDVINDEFSNHWISGYAGTGKTIVLTHIIELLINKHPKMSFCFLTYTHALKDLVGTGLSKKARDKINIQTADSFNKSSQEYDFIFIDEIQDLKKDKIDLIVFKCNHLIVAGDPDQSIYPGRVKESELLKILGNAKLHVLKDMQRLTQRLFQIAQIIQPEAKFSSNATVNSEGVNAQEIIGKNFDDECVQIYDLAIKFSKLEDPCAILLPKHDQVYAFAKAISISKINGIPPIPQKVLGLNDYDSFNNYFMKNKIPLRFLGSNNGSLPESDETKIIYLMTYHSAKGLDFSNVFLPNITDQYYLDAKPKSLSNEFGERRLFFVAVTRCKQNLYFGRHGKRHWLLDTIPDERIDSYQPPRRVLGAKR